jgi:hypothetical protein
VAVWATLTLNTAQPDAKWTQLLFADLIKSFQVKRTCSSVAAIFNNFINTRLWQSKILITWGGRCSGVDVDNPWLLMLQQGIQT